MREKGQVSVEFLIVLVLLLSLFLFSLAIFSEKNSGFILSKENYEARLVAKQVARTINYVHLAGQGTEARILLQKRVDFNVSVLGNAVVVEWRDNYHDAALLTDNVTVNSLKQGGLINVKNVSGVVEIENV